MFLMLSQKKSEKLHKNGEISIYLSLIFMLFISLVVSAVGAARYAAIQTLFECATESALCSVFGEYNRELLERYDVFFIDMSYLSNSPDPMNLEARINSYFADNLHPEDGTNLLFYSDIADVTGSNASITGYELATDYNGTPFVNEAVDYMKNLVGIQDAERIADLLTVFDSYDISEERFEETEENTISEIDGIETDSWEQTKIKEGIKMLILPDIDYFGLLGKNLYSLSYESINVSDSLTLRKKEKGYGFEKDEEKELLDRIYFTEYIMSKFGTFITPVENTKLRYEAEYILIGMGSDYYDLREILNCINSYRIVEDLISLNLAKDKMDVIHSVAKPIAAALKVPEIVISEFIALIWATAEAKADMWLLLDGKKVPIIKKSDGFIISADGLVSFMGEMIEKESEIGDELPPSADESDNVTIPEIEIGYNDYMRLFLAQVSPSLRAYRVMDLIEQNLRYCGSGENMYFRFDACVSRIRVKLTCESGYGYVYTTEKEYGF